MEKGKTKIPFPLVVGLIAIIALFFFNSLGSGGFFGGGEEQSGKAADGSLKMVLSEIEGVGEVELYFYQGNRQSGTGRTSNDFLSDYFSGTGSKSEELIGLLVVAEGADDIKVKKQLQDILTRVLQLPEHRIVIVPMKKKGEF